VSENPISDKNYATVTIRVDGHHITTFFFLHYFDMTVSEKNLYFELNVSRQCVEAILISNLGIHKPNLPILGHIWLLHTPVLANFVYLITLELLFCLIVSILLPLNTEFCLS